MRRRGAAETDSDRRQTMSVGIRRTWRASVGAVALLLAVLPTTARAQQITARVGMRPAGRVLADTAAARHAPRYEASDASLLPNTPTTSRDAAGVLPMNARGADRFDAPRGTSPTVVTGEIGTTESWVTPGGRVFTAYTLRVTTIVRAGDSKIAIGEAMTITRPGGRVETDGRVGSVIVPGFGVLPERGPIRVAVVAGPGDGAYREVRMPGGAR
jgi:hypothetical protein